MAFPNSAETLQTDASLWHWWSLQQGREHQGRTQETQALLWTLMNESCVALDFSYLCLLPVAVEVAAAKIFLTKTGFFIKSSWTLIYLTTPTSTLQSLKEGHLCAVIHTNF